MLMLSDARNYMQVAWWLPTFPELALLVTLLGINIVGDWLRDTLDPTLRGVDYPRARPEAPVLAGLPCPSPRGRRRRGSDGHDRSSRCPSRPATLRCARVVRSPR
jgi:hypothetical protein